MSWFVFQDNVSEAGTYTIEKDSPSPDVESARTDIDRVFGIIGEADQSIASPSGLSINVNSNGATPCHNSGYNDQEKFKV